MTASAASRGGPRRLIAVVLTWALIGFALELFAVSIMPLAFGMRTYMVKSGSMAPTIETGDLVISRSIRPDEAKLGDIVMFKDPDSGELISHRVRGIRDRGDRSYFVTRGDANNNFERWNVSDSGRIGEIVYRVPKLGFVVGVIASPLGKIFLLVIPSVALLAMGLTRIWRPERLAAGPAGEAHP